MLTFLKLIGVLTVLILIIAGIITSISVAHTNTDKRLTSILLQGDSIVSMAKGWEVSREYVSLRSKKYDISQDCISTE